MEVLVSFLVLVQIVLGKYVNANDKRYLISFLVVIILVMLGFYAYSSAAYCTICFPEKEPVKEWL